MLYFVSVRKDGFKLEEAWIVQRGFSQTFKTRMKLSQKTIEKKFSLPKQQ